MRHIIRVVLGATLAAAAAQASADSFRHDGKLLRVGDPTARIHNMLGPPDARLVIENRYGGATGMRWEYYSVGPDYGQKYAVTVDVNAGEVIRLDSEALR